jgi:hypothetical protein
MPKTLFVEIKSPNQPLQPDGVKELYAIDSQNDFYIECQINSQLSDQPQIHWWHESKRDKQVRILKTSSSPPPSQNASEQLNGTNKITIVSRVYIDCPNSDSNDGDYFCAAIDGSVYHKSQIRLKVLVPTPNKTGEVKKTCERVPYKMFGPSKNF